MRAVLQLRGIVATFRMTKRAQPDRPSHYVSAILNPLQAFLQGEAAGRLAQPARAELTQASGAGGGWGGGRVLVQVWPFPRQTRQDRCACIAGFPQQSQRAGMEYVRYGCLP